MDNVWCGRQPAGAVGQATIPLPPHAFANLGKKDIEDVASPDRAAG